MVARRTRVVTVTCLCAMTFELTDYYNHYKNCNPSANLMNYPTIRAKPYYPKIDTAVRDTYLLTGGSLDDESI